jgi:peptide/nickel transport system permease protein
MRRVRRLPIIPILILAIVAVFGVFGELLAPHDPQQADLIRRLQPPAWESGDWSRPLGTDALGRDIFSRIIVGARPSLIMALAVVLLAGSIGTTLALLSGYMQGFVDAAIMRVTDAVIAMPFLIAAIAIAGILDRTLTNLIIVIGVLTWSGYARVLRSEVLRIKQSDFVVLAKISGVPTYRILLRHIFPNLVNTLAVLATLQVGGILIAGASLDFLGLGVPRPTPTWGGDLADGRAYLRSAWWVITMPGIAIGATVMATNLLGDWLRNWLDPKQRGL